MPPAGLVIIHSFTFIMPLMLICDSKSRFLKFLFPKCFLPKQLFLLKRYLFKNVYLLKGIIRKRGFCALPAGPIIEGLPIIPTPPKRLKRMIMLKIDATVAAVAGHRWWW